MKVKKLHWTFLVVTVGYSLSFMAYLAIVLAIRLKSLDKNLTNAFFLWAAVLGAFLLAVVIWSGLRRFYGRFPGEPTVEQDKGVAVLLSALAVFIWAAVLLLSMLVTGFLMLHGLASPALAALVVLAAIAVVQLMLLNLFRTFIRQPE